MHTRQDHLPICRAARLQGTKNERTRRRTTTAEMSLPVWLVGRLPVIRLSAWCRAHVSLLGVAVLDRNTRTERHCTDKNSGRRSATLEQRRCSNPICGAMNVGLGARLTESRTRCSWVTKGSLSLAMLIVGERSSPASVEGLNLTSDMLHVVTTARLSLVFLCKDGSEVGGDWSLY